MFLQKENLVKTLTLPLLLAALPLAAAGPRMEVGLVLGQAQASGYTMTRSEVGYTSSAHYDPSDPTTLGLRFGIDLARAGKSDFQVTATWQPMAKADFLVEHEATFDTGAPYRGTFKAKYGYEYLAVGGRFTWKAPVELGVGLELRAEKVEFSAAEEASENASLTRPWITLHAGHTWAGARVSPFLRLELALALTKESAPNPNGNLSADDFIKPTAPTSHLMLIGGFRF